jgi:hypothetical protein
MGESTKIYYVQKRDFETEAGSGSTVGYGLLVPCHLSYFRKRKR